MAEGGCVRMERGPKVRGASRAHVHTHAKERNWGRTWLREGVSGWSAAPRCEGQAVRMCIRMQRSEIGVAHG